MFKLTKKEEKSLRRSTQHWRENIEALKNNKINYDISSNKYHNFEIVFINKKENLDENKILVGSDGCDLCLKFICNECPYFKFYNISCDGEHSNLENTLNYRDAYWKHFKTALHSRDKKKIIKAAENMLTALETILKDHNENIKKPKYIKYGAVKIIKSFDKLFINHENIDGERVYRKSTPNPGLGVFYYHQSGPYKITEKEAKQQLIDSTIELYKKEMEKLIKILNNLNMLKTKCG